MSVPLVPNKLLIPRPPSTTYGAPWPSPSGRRPGGSGVYVPTSTPDWFSTSFPTTFRYPSTVRPLTYSPDSLEHIGKPCVQHHGGFGLNHTLLPLTPYGSTVTPAPIYPPLSHANTPDCPHAPTSFENVPTFQDTPYSTYGNPTRPPIPYRPFTTVIDPPLPDSSNPCSLPPAFIRTNNGSPCLQSYPGSISSLPDNSEESTLSDETLLSILTNNLNGSQHDDNGGSGSEEHTGVFRDSRQGFPRQVFTSGGVKKAQINKEVNTPATIFENGWRHSNFSLNNFFTTSTTPNSRVAFSQNVLPTTPTPLTTRKRITHPQNVLPITYRPLTTTHKDRGIFPQNVYPSTFRPPTTRQGRVNVYYEQVTPTQDNDSVETLTQPSLISLNTAFPGGADSRSHHGPNVLWSLQSVKRHASHLPSAFNLTQNLSTSSLLTQERHDSKPQALPTVVKFPLHSVRSYEERTINNRLSNHSFTQLPRTLRPLTETTTDVFSASSDKTHPEGRLQGLLSPSRVLLSRPRTQTDS